MHVFIAVAAVDATTHILYGVCSESYTIGGDSRLYLRGRRISKNMLLSVDSRRRFEQVRKRLGNIIGGVNTRYLLIVNFGGSFALGAYTRPPDPNPNTNPKPVISFRIHTVMNLSQ